METMWTVLLLIYLTAVASAPEARNDDTVLLRDVSINDAAYRSAIRRKLVEASSKAFASKASADVDGQHWGRHAATNDGEKKSVFNDIPAVSSAATYKSLREQGFDEVSSTPEAIALRNYVVRTWKPKGIFHNEETSISELIFAGDKTRVYYPGERLKIQAGLVESKRTMIPYHFHDVLDCSHQGRDMGLLFQSPFRTNPNLGSRLQGFDYVPLAPFGLTVLKDQECALICRVRVDRKKTAWIQNLIEDKYRAHFQLDGMPLLSRNPALNSLTQGVPIGFNAYTSPQDFSYFLYNHWKLKITYRKHQDDSIQITAFDVQPLSIQNEIPPANTNIELGTVISKCQGREMVDNPQNYLRLSKGQDIDIIFSYEVQWEKNDNLEDRFDALFLGIPEGNLHYFAMWNAMITLIFLWFITVQGLKRETRKGVSDYAQMPDSEDQAKEPTGIDAWRDVVFRPPSFSPATLASCVGTGAQLGMTVIVTLLSALYNIASPMRKGQLLTSLVVCYVLTASVGGYISARLFKHMRGEDWHRVAIVTAGAFPGAMFLFLLAAQLPLYSSGAASAVSMKTMMVLLMLWGLILVPLTILGSYSGFNSPDIEIPKKTKRSLFPARKITPPRFHRILTIILSGALPVMMSAIELSFFMSSLWLKQNYLTMGFALIQGVFVTLACVKISILSSSRQLKAGDYRWWWNSFQNGAGAGGCVFVFGLWFLYAKMELADWPSLTVYLIYMSMFATCFGLYCGSVEFLASFVFLRALCDKLERNDRASI